MRFTRDAHLPRSVYTLQAGLVLNAFRDGAVSPFLIIYLHDVRRIPLGVAGLVSATGALSALATALVAGSLADHLDRGTRAGVGRAPLRRRVRRVCVGRVSVRHGAGAAGRRSRTRRDHWALHGDERLLLAARVHRRSSQRRLLARRSTRPLLARACEPVRCRGRLCARARAGLAAPRAPRASGGLQRRLAVGCIARMFASSRFSGVAGRYSNTEKRTLTL